MLGKSISELEKFEKPGIEILIHDRGVFMTQSGIYFNFERG
jgi:hypothetical protein